MIAAIEFDSNGRPRRIVRMRAPAGPVLDQLLEVVDHGHRLDEEDINYCKRDDCCYRSDAGSWTGRVYLHQLCGDGPPLKLWLHPEVTCSLGSGDNDALSSAEIKALGYDVWSDTPNPSLKRFCLSEGVTYYCERCDDNLPECDPCECVYWCNSCGDYWDKRTNPCDCDFWCDACGCERALGDCDQCVSSAVL